MSVLNDISVQDGLAIRTLAGSVSASNARSFLKVVRGFDAHRMDSNEYSVSIDADKDNVAALSNAHWLSDDNRYHWGLPSGSWKDYCDRIMQTSSFWQGTKYMPTTKTTVSETLSRDLLLATFMFPFVSMDKHADKITEHILMPLLKNCNPKKVIMGSKAVFTLVSKAGKDSASDIRGFTRNLDNNCSFKAFSSFSSAWSVSSSTNYHDAGAAVRRCDEVDWEVSGAGESYLCLAGFVNYLEARMSSAHPKSKIAKKAAYFASEDSDEREEAAIAIAAGGYYEYEAASERIGTWFASGKDKCVGTIESSPKFRCVTSRNVAIARIDGDYYVLTSQDMKSLKFAAMSHSMWHMYAGSIKMEYAASEVVEKAPTEHADSEIVRAAKALVEEAQAIIRSAGISTNTMRDQEIVSYDVVRDSLKDMWTWYQRTIDTSLRCGVQDCVGRYFSELFSLYTARQGGDLMSAALNDMFTELVEVYGALGFMVGYDCTVLFALFSKLPESAIQDFGRFQKIVPAYDVNPIYSYIDRASKMQTPNPRGKATMKGPFGVVVEELTEVELSQSLDKLRSAARVMLACSDIKQRILDALTDDERRVLQDEPYTVIIAKMNEMKRQVNTAARYQVTNDYHVPDDVKEEAFRQAKELINHGKMPTCEHAGAYLTVTDILAYNERGDPDLAILKATAIIPGRVVFAMSNISGVPRATPTRGNDGLREKGSGTMITDYLLGKFPSRSEALAFVAAQVPVASTSDKIETAKWPYKTRVITSMCAEGRRIQGEYEHNNGKVLVHVPGFMVGISPADRLKRTYASLRQDTDPGVLRLYGSLDLSSFSQGMHWDVQVAINDVMFDAYGLTKDAQCLLEKCTIDTYMIRVEANLRMFMVNDGGSNYEGLDGKRNTFMHCCIWYLARCEAYRQGVENPMRAFIYIDDGAFAIDVPEDELATTVAAVRDTLVKTYTEYGFKLNLSKTVISTSYMQFLNELFLHGVHIGYGFRALCHTAAQSFPVAASVSEELAVISGGIRGAGVAGGHSLRLLVGMTFILWLYTLGVVGSKGKAVACKSAYVGTLVLFLPTIAGGYGFPNWTQLFSNLAGNRDAEKLDRLATLSSFIQTYFPERYYSFENYVMENMLAVRETSPSFIPDRITLAHPGTARFGDLGRDMAIAKSALTMCRNAEAEMLIRKYVLSGGKPTSGGVLDILVKNFVEIDIPLPPALLDKAMATDATAAVVTMVAKISSSFLVERVLSPREIRKFDRKYRAVAKAVIEDAELTLA